MSEERVLGIIVSLMLFIGFCFGFVVGAWLW